VKEADITVPGQRGDYFDVAVSLRMWVTNEDFGRLPRQAGHVLDRVSVRHCVECVGAGNTVLVGTLREDDSNEEKYTTICGY
jgi:hypothetical protein